MDRARRQGEVEVLELVVQVGAAVAEEVAVVGVDAGCGGKAGLRGLERREAGQLAWAIRERVAGCDQAGQVSVGGSWVAAGHGLPERDRVPVYQQRLLDVLDHTDRWDVRGCQPPGDAQLPFHSREPVVGAGDPDHDRIDGQTVDGVLAEAQELGVAAAQSCLVACLVEYGEDGR